MIVMGEGILLSQTVKVSTKTGKPYCIVKLQDNEGGIFDMLSEKVNEKVELFKPVHFTCNVIQGKYPKYQLVEMNK